MTTRGSVNTRNQFLKPKIIIQRHPLHPKFQFSLIYKPRKRGTHQEPHKGSSQEVFLQMEELCDVKNTYPDIEPDVETNSEQPNISPTNPRSSKYNLSQT